MKKTIFALATAAVLAAGTLSAPTTAEARCYGCAVGAGVAAGVIGGAIIGGAIANSAGAYPAYAPAPGYVVYQGMVRLIQLVARGTPCGRCVILMATSSAGAVRGSSALKDRVTI
jgi:hypothetical protein